MQPNKPIDTVINELTEVLLPPLKSKNIIRTIIELFIKTFSPKRLTGAYKLSKLNWKEIGYGHFSRTFMSPCKKFAVRIAHDNEDAYCYHAFNAISHPKNPYFPNIYWHIFSPRNKENITLMEILDPCIWNSDCSVIEGSLPRYIKQIKREEVKEGTPKLLIEALNIIAKTLVDFDLLSDMSYNNILNRHNEIVITDPYMTYKCLSPGSRIIANVLNAPDR